MRHKPALAIASALIIGLSVAYAQDQRPAPEQNQQPPTGRGMGGMMGGMMGGDGMMAQMSRMMENCNKMMESHLQRHHQQQQQGR
jgi:hypothetical protein